MNNQILQYKDKINRYQKVMDILPRKYGENTEKELEVSK
jgi:hypothetical protein